MSRSKTNPRFDREKLEKEVLDAVVALYTSEDNKQRNVSYVADELGISVLKAKKLLITAGERNHTIYYSSSLAAKIQSFHKQGKNLGEIQELIGLSHASVVGYLPYNKTVYFMREISIDAVRIQRFRERVKLCEEYMNEVSRMEKDEEEEYLWYVLVMLAGCVFNTSGRNGKGGVKFRYSIKTDKHGDPSGEIKVNRKEKTITRATVMLAYWKAKEMRIVPEPKALDGKFEGSYLYPIFLRIGVCVAE